MIIAGAFVLGFALGALVTALVALWLSDPDDEPEREWTAGDLYDDPED